MPILQGRCLVNFSSSNDQAERARVIHPSPRLFDHLTSMLRLDGVFDYEGGPCYDVHCLPSTILLTSRRHICEGTADGSALASSLVSGTIESEEVVLRLNPPPIIEGMPPIYLKAKATCEEDAPALLCISCFFG